MKVIFYFSIFACVLASLTLFRTEAFAQIKTSNEAILRNESKFFFTDLKDKGVKRFEKIFYLGLDTKLSHKREWQMSLKPRFRFNSDTEFTTEEVYFNPEEMFLQYYNYPMRIQLGLQTYNWGTLEAFSPLDVVNPQVYFDPLRSEKVSTPSLNLRFEQSRSNLDLVYIPYQSRAALPGEDSRWLPRELLLNVSTEEGDLILPDTFQYYYAEDEINNHTLSHNFGAIFNLRLNNIDMKFAHFEGVPRTPYIAPILTVDPTDEGLIQDSRVGLLPIYYKVRTSGAAAVVTLDQWIFRFEGAYTHSLAEGSTASFENLDFISKWSWNTGQSLERQFYIGRYSVIGLFEAFQGKQQQASDNLSGFNLRLFDRSYALGFRLSLSTLTSITAKALYDDISKGTYQSLNFETGSFAPFSVGAQIDFLDGPKDSLLGTYRNNDRAVVYLKATW